MESDQIRSEMAGTRAAIDRDLDAIGARMERVRERVKDRAITWMPMAVIGAGLAATIAFWPRRHRHHFVVCVE